MVKVKPHGKGAPKTGNGGRCEECGKRGDTVKLSLCNGCGSATYCSTECQQAAWPVHKWACHLTCVERRGKDKMGLPPMQARAFAWAVCELGRIESDIQKKRKRHGEALMYYLDLRMQRGSSIRDLDGSTVIDHAQLVRGRQVFNLLALGLDAGGLGFGVEWAGPQAKFYEQKLMEQAFGTDGRLAILLSVGDLPPRKEGETVPPGFTHTCFAVSIDELRKPRENVQLMHPPGIVLRDPDPESTRPTEAAYAPPALSACSTCGSEASHTCSKCGTMAYCCREHQVEHWKEHKKSCKQRAALCQQLESKMSTMSLSTCVSPADTKQIGRHARGTVSEMSDDEVRRELSEAEQGLTLPFEAAAASRVAFMNARYDEICEVGYKIRGLDGLKMKPGFDWGDTPAEMRSDSPDEKLRKGREGTRRILLQVSMDKQVVDEPLKGLHVFDVSDVQYLLHKDEKEAWLKLRVKRLLKIDPAREFLIDIENGRGVEGNDRTLALGKFIKPVASESPIPSESNLVGECVRLRGLIGRPELNREQGTVQSWSAERGRYAVSLGVGNSILLRRENLEIV